MKTVTLLTTSEKKMNLLIRIAMAMDIEVVIPDMDEEDLSWITDSRKKKNVATIKRNKKTKVNIERVYKMAFAIVYPLYIKKVERKGRTKAEVDEIIFWLTGYDKKTLKQQLDKKSDFETFFAEAPQLNPNVSKITGMICGYRVEEIEEKLMQKIRYMDKLVDELAKGRKMEKILRK